jgi:hypothetical protein
MFQRGKFSFDLFFFFTKFSLSLSPFLFFFTNYSLQKCKIQDIYIFFIIILIAWTLLRAFVNKQKGYETICLWLTCNYRLCPLQLFTQFIRKKSSVTNLYKKRCIFLYYHSYFLSKCMSYTFNAGTINTDKKCNYKGGKRQCVNL